ncbi:MAG: inositol 2-dehydrogenase [Candidatus Puniceispirillales bacterium]|jgi:myo-inositol 2-dehydrogenase/D-chiro-inositol 1-dehydrogenase|tara:strand:- start:5415 stop:6413 length:999 start_codon:yes stop_codon:yes gene_type:complete
MKINLAIIGAGRIGKVHALAINNSKIANLVYIYDPDEEIAKKFSVEFNCIVSNIDNIKKDKQIDAVIICSPTDTHVELICIFSNYKKAIFCEKPIDLDIKKVRKCLETIEKNKTQFMIGFNRRFDPHFQSLKNSLKQDKIGNIETIIITSRDPGLPPINYLKQSGGIFKDMTIHDFDMAIFLLDELPVEIYSSASILIDDQIKEVEDFDTASVILKTLSGKQIIISNSRRSSYGYDQRIEVHGSLGMVSAENQRPVSIEIANSQGFTKPPLHHFFMTRYIDAYAEEINYFVNSLKSGSEIKPNGIDGLNALIIAEAAKSSLLKGKNLPIKYI